MKTTYTEEEWNNLTAEQQNDVIDRFLPKCKDNLNRLSELTIQLENTLNVGEK